MSQNLMQRGSQWYLRVATPKRLQDLRRTAGVRNPKEILKSLRTGDRAEAKRRLPATLAEVQRAWDVEEAELLALTGPLREPTVDELRAAADQFLGQELSEDTETRLRRPAFPELAEAYQRLQAKFAAGQGPENLAAWTARGGALDLEVLISAPELAAERRRVLAEELRRHRRLGQFVLVQHLIDDAVRSYGWQLEPGAPLHTRFAHLLIDGWLRALQIQDERDEGRLGAEEGVPALRDAPVAGETVKPAKEASRPAKGEGLRDYFDRYLKEAMPQLGQAGKKDKRAAARQFVECAGERPVTAYTKSDMTTFKRALQQAPKNVDKLFPGVPLPKAIALNREQGHPLLRTASIRNKLSTMSAFGEWLEANVDGVDAMSFKTTLPKKTDSQRMHPYSDDEVRAILNAPAFTGCASEKNQLAQGDHRIRDWRYWLVMIAAYSGARLNEIAQLRVVDIVREDGVLAFNFTDAGDGQSLKTTTSRRLVPVHPTLLELGLIRFRDRAAAAGHDVLFDAIPVDIDGRRSSQAGKWFRKFLARHDIGKGENGLGAMHRWRHTVTRRLRESGFKDHEIARILGHEVNAAQMTAHYGEGEQVLMTLSQRHGMLSMLTYEGVDLTRLK